MSEGLTRTGIKVTLWVAIIMSKRRKLNIVERKKMNKLKIYKFKFKFLN